MSNITGVEDIASLNVIDELQFGQIAAHVVKFGLGGTPVVMISDETAIDDTEVVLNPWEAKALYEWLGRALEQKR